MVALAVWVAGCASGTVADRTLPEQSVTTTTTTPALGTPDTPTTTAPTTTASTTSAPAATASWLGIELTDVVTGETFRITDFRGTPVFVESFAVWCPKCTQQLHEMKKVLDASEAVLVALDTDPNEDADRVLEHVRRNGFAGRFAVAPPEMTRILLDEYGPEIVAVPTTPVILVSPDQSEARLLDRGAKSAEKLLAELRATD